MSSPRSAPGTPREGGGEQQPAAMGPSREAPPAAENPVPVRSGPEADSPAAAQGRRILSTAFVRVGPDGRLAVELRDGRQLVLRDVVMRAEDYCGVLVLGDGAGSRYCGGYAEVAAARPGAAPVPEQHDPVVPNPARPGPGSL